jgi:hypothetical protein
MQKRTFRPAPASSTPGYPTLEEYARRRLLGLAGGVLLGAGIVSSCVDTPTGGAETVPDLVADGGPVVPGKDGGYADASEPILGGGAPLPDSGPVPDAAGRVDARVPGPEIPGGAAPPPDGGDW